MTARGARADRPLTASIRTPRLELRAATAAVLRADLESPAALAAALGADIVPSWPPELYGPEATRYALEALAADPGAAAWGTYYLLETGGTASRPLAIGIGGFRGRPDAAGIVEIGYSVAPERRRRGYAREAVDGWLAHAFADPRVARVVAHTLAHLEPSIAVLRSAGFAFEGESVDPDEGTVVRYALGRADYARAPVARHAVRLAAD